MSESDEKTEDLAGEKETQNAHSTINTKSKKEDSKGVVRNRNEYDLACFTSILSCFSLCR